MNRAQKIAWFSLIVTIIGIMVMVLASSIGMSMVAGIILVCMFGLVVVLPLILRRKEGRVAFDERDALIREKAWLVGLGASYGSLGGFCILQLLEVGLTGSIPISTFVATYIGGLACFIVSKSLITLFLYGWGGKSGQE